MKLIINSNAYEVKKNAVESIIQMAKGYAKTGAVYAVKKAGTVILLNEESDGKEYEMQGFEVLRKEKVDTHG
ncbi:MAG TPA: hypothetical protein VHP31_12255 [Caproicibacter sp.]|nr:hypothetical protein [Caproicibacter sp.]